jgi:hypothetical protein
MVCAKHKDLRKAKIRKFRRGPAGEEADGQEVGPLARASAHRVAVKNASERSKIWWSRSSSRYHPRGGARRGCPHPSRRSQDCSRGYAFGFGSFTAPSRSAATANAMRPPSARSGRRCRTSQSGVRVDRPVDAHVPEYLEVAGGHPEVRPRERCTPRNVFDEPLTGRAGAGSRATASWSEDPLDLHA